VADDPHRPDAFGNRPQGYPGVEAITYKPGDVRVPAFLPDTPTCRAELAQYYQSVSRVDQGVGRLVEVLREAGAIDNTLIVFTSDHGIAFPGAKTTLYEPGMVVPMIVAGPGIERRGQWCDAMVSLVDITPMLLDAAGALPDEANADDAKADAENLEVAKAESAKPDAAKRDAPKLHGRSFLAALNEEKPDGWDEVFASHTFHEITMYYPMRCVRTRKYKLIWNIAHGLPFPFASDLWEAPTWQDVYQAGPDSLYGRRTARAYLHRPKFELFDLESDPDETQNLSDDPHYADVLKDMQGRIKEHQQRTSDPWILKWEYE
jgi:N-sulfoglucosamine sulfohydrolase